MERLLFRSSTKKEQRTFFDPDFLLEKRPLKPESFPVRFRQICDQVLPDALFASLYSGLGRPPISPSVLIRLHLLMYRDNCGDEQVVENLLYDDRYRYMCNLAVSDCLIHPTTLHYFRLRLIFGTINRAEITRMKAEGILLRETPAHKIFEETKRVAVVMGLLDAEAAQYLDSTYILGAAAVQDTFTLLFQGIRQAVRACEQATDGDTQQALLAHLRRAEYVTEQAKPEIDWRDAEARTALLVDLVRDAATLLVMSDGLEDPAVQTALAQLQRLVAQDIEVSEDGQAKIRQGVAKDRQCSVVDPEMRHGRKSSSKRFNGYKVHVAMEPTHGILTAITTTDGSLYDGEATSEILTQTHPAILGGDNAYAGPEQRAAALAQGTAILTPTSPLKPYEKDNFTLDDAEQTVTCPAGQTSALGKTGQVHFSKKVCTVCPFHGECNPSGKGRSLTIGPHEILQRNLRAAARSGSWDDFLRFRCKIEHTIARFIRWAGRKGRYFGTVKKGFQMIIGGIGYNLEKLGKAHAQQRASRGQLA